MTREIKFRAWDKQSKEMFDVISLHQMGDGALIVTGLGGSAKVDEDTIIMQYTGLKDKNGKEIYEGDIVMFNDSGYTEFGWGKVLGEVVWVDCSFNVSVFQPKQEFFWDIEDNENWEVVGNIYENPELLTTT